jgi:hypothetical protein
MKPSQGKPSGNFQFRSRLLLGNLVKPCHPRSVGLSKFMKQVHEMAVGEGTDL